jgi:hypothetical protein
LGLGDRETRKKPVQVNQKTKFASISCGDNHSVGLTINGEIYMWGLIQNLVKNDEIIEIKLMKLNICQVFDVKMDIGTLRTMDDSEYQTEFLESQETIAIKTSTKITEYCSDIKFLLISPHKLIIKEKIFAKVSCGPNYTSLLCNDGEIFFLSNGLGRISRKTDYLNSKELINDSKIIDIASLKHCNTSIVCYDHMKIFSLNFSLENGLFLIIPCETKFKELNHLIFEDFGITNGTIEIIEGCKCFDTSHGYFSVISSRNLWLKRNFDSMDIKEIKKNGEYNTYFVEEG